MFFPNILLLEVNHIPSNIRIVNVRISFRNKQRVKAHIHEQDCRYIPTKKDNPRNKYVHYNTQGKDSLHILYLESKLSFFTQFLFSVHSQYFPRYVIETLDYYRSGYFRLSFKKNFVYEILIRFYNFTSKDENIE